MASFTAKDVQALREKTNVGMMDCKKALVEADGDMDKAIDLLREKGLATAAKKAGRIAAEGIVVAYNDEAKKVGVVVELNIETDFAAKNESFKEFALDVAKTIVENNPADVEALYESKFIGSDMSVKDAQNEVFMKIRENMNIRRFERVEGPVATYVHAGGSVGVMVEFDADDAVASKEEFKVMGKDVAMQIAAMSPQYVCPKSVPEDVVEHEKGIQMAQIKADPKMAGKPEKVLENIIGGKINKFFKEICLVEQAFVKDGDISVGKYVENVAKEIGSDIKIKSFIRFAKGEGMEKKEDDFAAEVASMMN